MKEDSRFALLIDADNISDKYIKIILNELSNDGTITYKRIYGDWTKQTMNAWKSVLLDHSITPVQQYAYTTGKNATDAAMIIDAMDILYTGKVEGFCLVSSDSDFTRLASRLRESGMFVVGMGEKKTPPAFVAACNRFRYLDVLAQKNDTPPVDASANGEKPAEVKAAETPSAELQNEAITPLPVVAKAILSIVEESSDDDGWCSLSVVGNILSKRFPAFDVRNYKYSKLTPFIRSLRLFELRCVRKHNLTQVDIRAKQIGACDLPRKGV